MADLKVNSISNAMDNGAPDFPNNIQLNGTEISYSTTTISATSGDITSGSFFISKLGNQVTITATGQIGHNNVVGPESAAGFVPAEYRPSSNVSNVYGVSTGRVMRVNVESDGTIGFDYHNWSGTAVANSNSDTAPSITYYVA